MSDVDLDICMSPDCGVITAAADFRPSQDVLRRRPELDLFCLPHFKQLMAVRSTRAAAEKIQCRQDGCTNEGVLYPGGRWCPEHTPHTHPSVLQRRVPLVESAKHLLAGAAGHELTGIGHIAGRVVVDVELPESDRPLGDSEKKSESEIRSSARGAILSEALLYSTEMAEDDPRLTSIIRSALKTAKAHGWNTKVTVAIASDEMFSMQFRATHFSGKSLTTRHEQPAGKLLGFKVAWYQKAPRGLPHKIGWREAMAVLKGEDPTDDRPALIEAMHVATETLGAEIVRVEVTA